MSNIGSFLDEIDKQNFNSWQLLEIVKGLTEDKLSVEMIKEFFAREEFSAEKMASIRQILKDNKLVIEYILKECWEVSEKLQNDDDIEIKRNRLYLFLESLENQNLGELKLNLHLPKDLFTSIVFEKDDNGIMQFVIPFKSLKMLDLTDLDFNGVCIYEFDFSDTLGVTINPQTVYNKDLRKCIFKGVTFEGTFANCLVNASDFTGSFNAKIILEDVRNQDISGFIDFKRPDFNDKWVMGESMNELACYTNLSDTTIVGDIEEFPHNYVVLGNALIRKKEKSLVRKKKHE